MFKRLAVLSLFLPVSVWAQGKALSFGLGLDRGALNLGVQYDRKAPGFEYGGYVLHQADREKNSAKVVYQVTSLGAQIKAHLVQNSWMDVFAAPGFGVHLFKDIPDGGISKSDVTAWGPTLRLGVLCPLPTGIRIGFERFEISNWFDDKPPATVPFYQATMVMDF